MDNLLCSSCKEQRFIKMLVVTHDIVCSYHVTIKSSVHKLRYFSLSLYKRWQIYLYPFHSVHPATRNFSSCWYTSHEDSWSACLLGKALALYLDKLEKQKLPFSITSSVSLVTTTPKDLDKDRCIFYRYTICGVHLLMMYNIILIIAIIIISLKIISYDGAVYNSIRKWCSM